jgi:hypothetical protein
MDFRRSVNNPGAILNTDNTALKMYKQAKRKAIMDKNEINSLKEEINDLKILVKQLLEKNK